MASSQLIDDDGNGNEEEQPLFLEVKWAKKEGIPGEKWEWLQWQESAYPPNYICHKK